MNRAMIPIAVAGLGLIALVGCAAQRAHFGEPMKLETERPLTVTHVMREPEKYEGHYVRVRGTVRDLCTHSGCWMELAHNATDQHDGLLVVFTYDRTKYRVPPEAKGHEAIVEGTVSIKVISEAQRRHFAEDEGATPEEIAKITGPEKVVRLECPAASIERVTAGDPQACEHESE